MRSAEERKVQGMGSCIVIVIIIMEIVHKSQRSCEQQAHIGRHTFVPENKHDFSKEKLKTRKSNKKGKASYAHLCKRRFQTAWWVTFSQRNLCY